METYSITLDQKTINEIVKEYSSYLVKSNNPYLTYCIKLDDANINIYSSCKVVFQGKNSLYYYQKYKKDDSFFVHGGSDEVGTGDFFGPICVCAVSLNEKSLDLIKPYNITDSKQLTDKYISDIVEKVINKIDYSLLILNNRHYVNIV